MNTSQIKLCGLSLTVGWTVQGKNIDKTLEYPQESEYIEIRSIESNGLDLMDLCESYGISEEIIKMLKEGDYE